MKLGNTAGIRRPRSRRPLLAATALMIAAGGLSGCATSELRTISAHPAAIDPPFVNRSGHGSDYVTIVDFSTIRNALRENRSAPSANLTAGQKAAALGGAIVLVLLALNAMDATDDLSGHVEDPALE